MIKGLDRRGEGEKRAKEEEEKDLPLADNNNNNNSKSTNTTIEEGRTKKNKQKKKNQKEKKIPEPKSAADENLVYFVMLLFGVATGENMPSDLIRTAGNSVNQYGYYSKIFIDIFNVGVRWQYGIAKACEIVSEKVKSEEFKLMLMKMAQVFRLGEDLRGFFRHELDATMNAFTAAYERKIKSMELLMEMYSTMMSTSSFMIAAMMILVMLSGGQGSSTLVIGAVFSIQIGLAAFIFIMHVFFPKDKLMHNDDIREIPEVKKFKSTLYICLGLSVSMGIILTVTRILPATLAISIAGGPLLFAGMKARKIDSNIRKLDDYYPSFVMHLGDIYNTVGSVGQALRSVRRSDFGGLSRHIDAMYYRIMNRIAIEDSFSLFSKESGSALIKRGNTVLSNCVIKGANMLELGITLSEVSAKFLEIRKRRVQFSKTLESTILIMHILTLAVFSLINSLMSFLNGFFSAQNSFSLGTSSALTISSIDPSLLAVVLPALALSLSGINAMAVKISQGGLYYTIWYTLGVLLVLSGIVLFGVDQFLSNMLGSITSVTNGYESIVPK